MCSPLELRLDVLGNRNGGTWWRGNLCLTVQGMDELDFGGEIDSIRFAQMQRQGKSPELKGVFGLGRD